MPSIIITWDTPEGIDPSVQQRAAVLAVADDLAQGMSAGILDVEGQRGYWQANDHGAPILTPDQCARLARHADDAAATYSHDESALPVEREAHRAMTALAAELRRGSAYS